MTKDLYTLADHFFPVRIVFPATKKAYRALMREMGADCVIPKVSGCMEEFSKPGEGIVLVLWLSKDCEKRDAAEVLGLLAHECLHVVQYTERAIGTRFDDETACYFLQKLIMWAMAAYAESGRGYKQ